MKQRRLGLVLFTLFIALAPAVFILAHSVPALSVYRVEQEPETENQPGRIPNQQKIDEDLLARLVEARPDETLRFIVYLRQTAELAPQTLPSKVERRRVEVVQRLRQIAASSQASLLRQLQAGQANSTVTTYRPFWIFNGVAVQGTARAIHEIAARPDVSHIALDAQHQYFKPPTDTLGLESFVQVSSLTDSPSWGVSRVGAPYVWHGLNVNGNGVTVAIMDTGVDWLHPVLNSNYRGNLGNGQVEHAGNWYHTATPTVTEPIDLIGHGTHVAGTAVGQSGIGVAPGAQWIAVSIADANGFIFDSQVHSGFEWLLAPNGDPALAPDIVNNSWSGSGQHTTYVDDVAALQAAGIVTVFAAGNNGPFPASIGVPASYTNTIAVGASDDIDEVAWFSSRGPSPLTNQLKPLLVAPGTNILSALPDGKYGYWLGTSMATPHVVGTLALLLSANSGLSRQAMVQILAETAVPISTTHPNDSSGWGRLNTYAAVSQRVETGVLQGTIRGNGVPLPGVPITITTATGNHLSYETDERSHFQATLRPGLYDLTAAAFGFASRAVTGIAVENALTTTHTIRLEALPVGTVQGVVRQAGTGEPLSATVRVLGTPITVHTDSDGRYTLSLPQNQYKLLVSAPEHRLGRAVALAQVGQTTAQDFSLAPAPSILLVDSGQWYYDSYADYYHDSFTALNYVHDRWTIRNPFQDVPTTSDLANYEIVIWSAPQDSPGYLGANNVITDYLGSEGHLLISGQNVGTFDGQGSDTQLWWYRDLEAHFIGEANATQAVRGANDTLFAGIKLTLNSGDSANNQITPDQVRPRDGSLSKPILHYDDGRAAGLQAGHCRPGRIVYFGFGLEGVSDAADRAAILNSSMDYFMTPSVEEGLKWDPSTVEDFALPGQQLVYTLTLRNLSETMTDTFQLDLFSATWSTSLVTPTLQLGPCQQGQTVLKIDVPNEVPVDSMHTMQVTAVSNRNTNLTADLNLQHKIPGHILLVDDDRWYDQEETFQAALDAMDLSYDVWNIGWDEDVRGSPPLEFLNAYDIVIWYTGYDWFAPITAVENQALSDYLAQGGRLFLSSQDFLYYHDQTPLARHYLGVLDYRESITPTQAYGGNHPAISSQLAGPLPLTYDPYQNFSDGLIPAPGGQPFLWHDQGMAAGLATAEANWRTVFWGVPFETLPNSSQATAMNSVIGWLSDLGESTFVVDKRTGPVDETRTFTITLRNVDNAPHNQVTITNTLPAELNIDPETITGDAVYDPTTHQLKWQDDLNSGAEHQITYEATSAAGLANGQRLDNRLAIHYERHNLRFNRVATMWVNAPDLSNARLTASPDSSTAARMITYTLQLHNSGLAATNTISAVVRLPDELTPLTDTLHLSQGVGRLDDHRLLWQADLNPNETITASLVLTREVTAQPSWLLATAVIQDGVTDTVLRHSQFYITPYTQYLPFIAKN